MKRESLTLRSAVLLIVMLQFQAAYVDGFPAHNVEYHWFQGIDPDYDTSPVIYGQRGLIKDATKWLLDKVAGESVGGAVGSVLDAVVR
ncbi:hypothetical protein GE061_011709 [Apolygus lucorum]|uniref:Uncharacterized protein n=1 Tax=Apolygus lucorum TaxID=248454 RepID=A0A6A4K8F6_APOLU|nr:hypothetical protein GE061_011709 [Apolygus lucorum]